MREKHNAVECLLDVRDEHGRALGAVSIRGVMGHDDVPGYHGVSLRFPK